MAVLTNLLFVVALRLTVTTKVDLHKRIINGMACHPDERQYHVRIDALGDLCGGSLISDRWILTAGHCRENILDMKAFLTPHPGPEKEVPLTGQPHVFTDQCGEHDIMLLQLKDPTSTPNIRLPNCQNRLKQRDRVRIAGYGIQVGPSGLKDGPRATVLQCGDFEVKDQRVPKIKSGSNCTHGFCVDTTLVDISPGDSGGGVEFNGAIYGVIVAGSNFTHLYPAFFVDVCYYMDWITNLTGIKP